MILFLSLVLLAALTLVAISVQKTFSELPAKELKRRAAKGNEVAELLYRAVSYGVSLQILLWGIVGLCAAGFFVLLARSLPAWLAMSGAVALVWLGFAWLPNSRVTNAGNKLTKTLTPSISWLLAHLQPLLGRVVNFLKTRVHVRVHTGLFQKDDLLELIDKQAAQSDNRIELGELDIARHALVFGDKIIRDVMTPLRVVKMVKSTDSVGPILLDELHKSGFSRYPVQGEKKTDIVGTLYLHDLVVAKQGGTVKDLMSKKVYYVNEEKPLQQVLDAFIKTKHHLFVVVNQFEELVGVITIEDIIEEVLGKQIVDEFDKYDDLRAVAAAAAKKDKTAHQHVPNSDNVESEPATNTEKP